MLGLFKRDSIEGEIDDALIVSSETSRAIERDAQVKQKVAKEQNFLDSGTHSKKFSLSARHGDGTLRAGIPVHRSRHEGDDAT